MKALLQQVGTGLYFQGPGQWTLDHAQAFDFKSSVAARTYCMRQSMNDVQIILKFEVDKYDIILPARHKSSRREPGAPGPTGPVQVPD